MEPQPLTTTVKGKFSKFRVWDEDKKKFYFSGDTLVSDINGVTVIAPFSVFTGYLMRKECKIHITEFTGILDTSGKLVPIYTGDIVVLSKRDGSPGGRGVVKWLTEVACFNVSIDLMNGHKMVVVGNVFQDEHLLKELLPVKPQLDLSGNINKALADTKKLPN